MALRGNLALVGGEGAPGWGKVEKWVEGGLCLLSFLDEQAGLGHVWWKEADGRGRIGRLAKGGTNGRDPHPSVVRREGPRAPG